MPVVKAKCDCAARSQGFGRINLSLLELFDLCTYTALPRHPTRDWHPRRRMLPPAVRNQPPSGTLNSGRGGSPSRPRATKRLPAATSVHDGQVEAGHFGDPAGNRLPVGRQAAYSDPGGVQVDVRWVAEVDRTAASVRTDESAAAMS